MLKSRENPAMMPSGVCIIAAWPFKAIGQSTSCRSFRQHLLLTVSTAPWSVSCACSRCEHKDGWTVDAVVYQPCRSEARFFGQSSTHSGTARLFMQSDATLTRKAAD
jgi:hypothetical protein